MSWGYTSLVPRPTLAAADGLHHRYARNGSGRQPNKSRSGHLQKKKRTIRMQSTCDVTTRVLYVNKLHGYLNGRDNGTVYFAFQRS